MTSDRLWQRAYRERRQAEGLCCRCGKPRGPKAQKWRCLKCAYKASAKDATRRVTKDQRIAALEAEVARLRAAQEQAA